MPADHPADPAQSGPLRYHHARTLAHVRHGLVVPVRETDVLPAPAGPCASGRSRCDYRDPWHLALHTEAAYAWLAERVGFWPLFLAVGKTDDNRRLTGYQSQWSRFPNWAPPGRPRDLVLFSWSAPPAGTVHCCFGHWSIVLNSVREGERPHELRVEFDDRRAESWVLHRSWRTSDWYRQARRWPGSVQAVAPLLDLASAEAVWAPNQRVARELERMGFGQVEVRRLRVE
jgi:hypothetical protein